LAGSRQPARTWERSVVVPSAVGRAAYWPWIQ
jgi:hypothetical protein